MHVCVCARVCVFTGRISKVCRAPVFSVMVSPSPGAAEPSEAVQGGREGDGGGGGVMGGK